MIHEVEFVAHSLLWTRAVKRIKPCLMRLVMSTNIYCSSRSKVHKALAVGGNSLNRPPALPRLLACHPPFCYLSLIIKIHNQGVTDHSEKKKKKECRAVDTLLCSPYHGLA